MTSLSAQAERFANLVAVAPSPTAPKENALTRRGRSRVAVGDPTWWRIIHVLVCITRIIPYIYIYISGDIPYIAGGIINVHQVTK